MEPKKRVARFLSSIIYAWTAMIFVGLIKGWDVPHWQYSAGVILFVTCTVFEVGFLLFEKD